MNSVPPSRVPVVVELTLGTEANGGAAKASEPPPSFDDFYMSNRLALKRALFVMTGSREDAEELLQEAFMVVWERWSTVGTLDDPTAYLFRVAINKHRSRLRRARVAARTVFGPRRRDELTAIDQTEDRVDVGRALSSLSQRRREAIVLTELLEYDSARAGDIMGVASSTVRRLAQDAREQLKEMLEAPHD